MQKRTARSDPEPLQGLRRQPDLAQSALTLQLSGDLIQRRHSSTLHLVEYEITWGGDPEDACVTTSGEASLEGFYAWMQEGLSDPRYRDGMSFILDHRALDWSGISHKDVQERIALIRRETHIGHIRVAMVMRAIVDFGLARMNQAYLDLQPDLRIEIGVFTLIDEAREWLRERKAEEATRA